MYLCRGLAGDLYIVLHIDEKRGIKRDGLNLYSKINVYYTEAILGTTIKVPIVFNTPLGKGKLYIPFVRLPIKSMCGFFFTMFFLH